MDAATESSETVLLQLLWFMPLMLVLLLLAAALCLSTLLYSTLPLYCRLALALALADLPDVVEVLC